MQAGGVDLNPGLHRRRDLVSAGYTDGERRRAVRAGEMAIVRPGSYLVGPAPEYPEGRHLLLIRAVGERLAADAVVSHVSAAVMHGLPVWNVLLDRVEVTRARDGGGRRRRTLHVRSAPLSSDQVVTVGGLAVTSPARTVADVARILGFTEAVVIADAALRCQLVTRADLEEELERAAGWPGLPAARRVVAFADGRSESPGESRSRVAIRDAGLPAPVLQWPVHSATGEVLGYADFAWPRLRTVGEFDGRTKYGRTLRPGESIEQAVYREKLREDAFRCEDLWVARWIWAEIPRFDAVAQRIRRGFRPS